MSALPSCLIAAFQQEKYRAALEAGLNSDAAAEALFGLVSLVHMTNLTSRLMCGRANTCTAAPCRQDANSSSFGGNIQPVRQCQAAEEHHVLAVTKHATQLISAECHMQTSERQEVHEELPIHLKGFYCPAVLRPVLASPSELNFLVCC
jgi:hypothetical protein